MSIPTLRNMIGDTHMSAMELLAFEDGAPPSLENIASFLFAARTQATDLLIVGELERFGDLPNDVEFAHHALSIHLTNGSDAAEVNYLLATAETINFMLGFGQDQSISIEVCQQIAETPAMIKTLELLYQDRYQERLKIPLMNQTGLKESEFDFLVMHDGIRLARCGPDNFLVNPGLRCEGLLFAAHQHQYRNQLLHIKS